MTISASPATLDTSTRIAPRIFPQALLTTPAHFAAAPWQYTVFSKLHDLERGRGQVGRVEDLTPAQPTIMFARTVIADLTDLNIPAPTICPVSGGAVGMIWSLGSKQLEVVFAHDQTGSFVLSQGDQIIEDGDVSAQSTKELEWALKSIISV
jgi:hypothetical protein